MAITHSAIVIVAMALCTEMCVGAATTNVVSKKLRGGGHRRLRLHEPDAASEENDDEEDVEEEEDVEQQQASPDAEGMAPLYDDFLDIMNHAASKALQQQRAIPAYEDFLHLMKHSAEKAYKEQAGAPSYDDFLGLVNGQADHSQQKQEMPSYDDFLVSLKASSVEALKTPVPSYEEFLTVLKSGAENAMQKREQSQLNGKTLQSFGEKVIVSQNPLQKMGDAIDDAMAGKKDSKDDDDTHKLEEELRQLKAENARKGAEGHPDGAKKPIMKRINVLRTQLCWKRPNLWQHEKCLRFLGIHCMQESTGEGICRQFTKEAGKKCKTASDDNEFKDDYCALSEALSDNYEDEDEEEEVEEEEEEEEEKELKEDEEGKDAKASPATDEAKKAGPDGPPEVKAKTAPKEGPGSDKDIADQDEKDAEAIDAGKEGEEDEVIEEEAAEEVSDRDGDGVPDSEDAFADDPNEWKDTDKDGIGDNSDDDIDGDGHKNADDIFPNDPKEWLDSDHDGIGDNADKDRDNDGIENDKDKFPDDPTEWKDSDEDGVGDNKDAFPYNPNCHDPALPCENIEKHGVPKPGSPQDPVTLDKDALRLLPDQGYNEYMTGPKVAHNNYYTYVGDWQDEFPEMQLSEKNTMDAICKEHPENSWCTKFQGRDSHFR